MKSYQLSHSVFAITIIILTMLMNVAVASSDLDAQNKLVIQVSSNDPLTQKIALNNAVNLQKYYGMDNVKIEVVAYGPGLGLLTQKSEYASRIKSLAMQDITFSACNNTIKKVTKKTGKQPQLTEGVAVVPAGVVRIMELQQEGYSYLRP